MVDLGGGGSSGGGVVGVGGSVGGGGGGGMGAAQWSCHMFELICLFNFMLGGILNVACRCLRWLVAVEFRFQFLLQGEKSGRGMGSATDI